MRLKRSEYENLKESVKRLRYDYTQIKLNQELEPYMLTAVVYYDGTIRINNLDGDILYYGDNIVQWFEGYKDGIENGDIFVECNCEEQPKKVLNSKKK